MGIDFIELVSGYESGGQRFESFRARHDFNELAAVTLTVESGWHSPGIHERRGI